MILFKSLSLIFLLLIHIHAQSSTYTAYQTSFPYVTTCPTGQYFDIALLQCSACPTNTTQKSTGNI